MHGREWISPATVTYMINELVTNSGAYNDLLSNVNFYVMPVINPDGYDYTFTDVSLTSGHTIIHSFSTILFTTTLHFSFAPPHITLGQRHTTLLSTTQPFLPPPLLLLSESSYMNSDYPCFFAHRTACGVRLAHPPMKETSA